MFSITRIVKLDGFGAGASRYGTRAFLFSLVGLSGPKTDHMSPVLTVKQ